jgi:hypothetical protein
MLGCGEMSAVYGSPGCGKGVGVEDMGLHIAARLKWHGRPVTGGAVVYIALERKKLVERRALAFRKKHYLHGLPFAIVGGVYDFRNPVTATQITDICTEVEKLTGESVVLIVVDTVSRALAGGDENSPRDMGAFVTTTALIQELTKAHVLLVHHIPHEGDRLRGHGSLLGAVDTTLSVTNAGGVRSFKVVKANDSEEGESIAFTIDGVQIGSDGTTAPVAVPADISVQSAQKLSEPQLSANQKTLLAMLSDAPPSGLTVEEWNAQAREAGIGVKRKADLNDIRDVLKRRNLARQYGDRWIAVKHI